MNKTKKLILLLGDLLILNFSLVITIFIRYRLVGQDPRNLGDIFFSHYHSFGAIFGLWILCFYILGLYRPYLLFNGRNFNRNALSSIGYASIISIIFFYFQNSAITPKTNLFLFIAVFSVIFLAWRRLYNSLLKSYLPKNHFLIIGQSTQAEKLLRNIQLNPQLGWKSEGIIATNESEKLEEMVREKGIKTIILNTRDSSEDLQQKLFECLKLKVNFFSFPHFYELVTGKIPVEEIDRSWFLENLNEGKRGIYGFIKKTFDLFGASLLLLASLPFWPFIAMLIKIDSRGPIFFKQERVGKNEKSFFMIKFRTMRIEGNSGLMTAEKDPRITKLGNFLRKTRIDEIPQVLNILRGEMSFIGPRPERPEFVSRLTEKIPFYKTRLLIKPGISGWDQVSGIYHSPSDEDSLEKLQYDLFYIKHRSLYLDLTIILRTIATVISKSGR